MRSGVTNLHEAQDVAQFGGKAVNLSKMLQAGLPVPDGFVVSHDMFDKNGKLTDSAMTRVSERLDKSITYAVRSSATVEDAEGASWAGQFESYLNVTPSQLADKIEACHNSIKPRAQAYAGEGSTVNFQVAVIVQEMVAAKVAGVMFTKDPSSGANKVITEYVYGLGEALVHGDVDPERVIWSRSKRTILDQTEKDVPFPLPELVKLAQKAEKVFGSAPQDIEWVYDGVQLKLVQSRPITTLQDRGIGKHYLGDPGKLFYWGPSRALPLYMSDFNAAFEVFVDQLSKDPSMPMPPKTLVLFHGGQTVWLIKETDFSRFVSSLFRVYERADRLQQDWQKWKQAAQDLDSYFSTSKSISIAKVNALFLTAWGATLAAEFALYGAETVLLDRLARFDEKPRHEIWGTMTLPNQPTFMQSLDIELATSQNPVTMAKKYSWIQDGYSGVFSGSEKYFSERLQIVKGNTTLQAGSPERRKEVIKTHKLKPNEIRALNLARDLSVFMDERKAWMMRSRAYIQQAAKAVSHHLNISDSKIAQTTLQRLSVDNAQPFAGGSFLHAKLIELSAEDVNLAWDWYVEFRASKSVLNGLVASSGGRHFINGEVFVAQSPQDAMPDNSVLVVPSTSPSYVPLMRKARALVTDHGGMMSHAAIVAREFGLPAIVGTKRATKILKNGDKIVLDLVKGQVNK